MVEAARIEGAKIPDIVGLIMQADKKSGQFIGDVSGLLGRTEKETLKNVWAFVRSNVRYKEDGGRVEVVKSPRAAIITGYADCKSMAVMTGAILKKMGLPYFYRVVFYEKNRPNSGHIYVVAKTNDGEKVVVDPVDSVFNRETPYWKKTDYSIGKIESIKGSGNWVFLAIAAFLIFFK